METLPVNSCILSNIILATLILFLLLSISNIEIKWSEVNNYIIPLSILLT
jgi:hypothetical protein